MATCRRFRRLGSIEKLSACRVVRSRQFLPRVGPLNLANGGVDHKVDSTLESVRVAVAEAQAAGHGRVSGRSRPGTPARMRLVPNSVPQAARFATLRRDSVFKSLWRTKECNSVIDGCRSDRADQAVAGTRRSELTTPFLDSHGEEDE